MLWEKRKSKFLCRSQKAEGSSILRLFFQMIIHEYLSTFIAENILVKQITSVILKHRSSFETPVTQTWWFSSIFRSHGLFVDVVSIRLIEAAHQSSRRHLIVDLYNNAYQNHQSLLWSMAYLSKALCTWKSWRRTMNFKNLHCRMPI